MKDTLQFFIMVLFWLSSSETPMNMETIIIFVSYVSGFSIVFPFKHVMPQLHSLNVFGLIIEVLQPVLYCLCQEITEKNENRLTLEEML